MQKRTSQILIGLIVLLWLAIGLAFYFLYHRPFTPTFASQIVLDGWQLLIVGLVVSVAGGVGKRVLRVSELPAVAQLSMQAAMGLGILGLVYFFGALVSVHPVVAWGLLLTAGVIFRREIWAWWQAWKAVPALWRDGDGLVRFSVISCGMILLFTLLVVLCPPLRFDSLVYHQTLPRMYLEAGRFVYVPELMFWGFPQLTHMLYTWVLALGAARMALLTWAAGMLTILGLIDIIRWRMSMRVAWVGAASLLAGFSVASSLTWGYMDWTGMLFGWALLVALDSWRQTMNAKWLRYAGLLTGFAFGTKYTAGILLITGLTVVMWQTFKIKARLWNLLLNYLIPAGLVALPWLIKNLIATGNPFYPLLLRGGAMDQIRINLFQGKPVEGNWLDLVFLPLRVTFWGIDLGTIGDAPNFEISIGPLLLLFGALAWLGWKHFSDEQKTFVGTATVIGLSGLLVWAVGGRLSGYLIRTHLYFSLFPAFVILAAVGFAGVDRLSIPGARIGRIAAAILVLVLAFNVIQVGMDTAQKGALGYLLGLKSGEDYVTENLGVYFPAMQALKQLPEGSKVLMLWETRGYYCMPVCDSDEVIDRWQHDWAVYGDVDAVKAAWGAEGYTHVMYFKTGADFVRENDTGTEGYDWGSLDELLGSLPEVENFNDAYVLYGLNEQ
ncbi:MAG: hypothetical protein JXB38_00555 [Anaerolineales bacterium]|nr:hypothetical protein [Anaerolineales bacterium]